MRISTTAYSAPPARSAIGIGGSAGAVSSSSPAQPHVGRADAEPFGDAGAESLEHDVGARAQLPSQFRIALQVPDDRFLACVQRGVPAGRDGPEWIALRCLDPHDSRAAV